MAASEKSRNGLSLKPPSDQFLERGSTMNKNTKTKKLSLIPIIVFLAAVAAYFLFTPGQ
jgi:hypothetical protein